jgi:hypothetical protein
LIANRPPSSSGRTRSTTTRVASALAERRRSPRPGRSFVLTMARLPRGRADETAVATVAAHRCTPEPYGATNVDVSAAAAWLDTRVPGRQPTIDLLSRVPLFEGLPKAHLTRVASLAEESDYAAGRVIVKRDDPGRAFYVIVEGTAKVVKGKIVTSKGEATLGPGDFFGELSLLDGDARSATVVAETPLTVIRIERVGFRRLLREEPDLAIKLLEGMARRTRAILDTPAL